MPSLTHDVVNQAPPLVDYNPFDAYPAHAPPAVADAFCASRLGRDGGHAYGTLPSTTDFEGIVERAWRQ